jgi:hypothetical protein
MIPTTDAKDVFGNPYAVGVISGLVVVFICNALGFLLNYVRSTLSYYWERRTTKAAARQLNKLQNALRDYEQEYADTNRFVAKCLFKAVATICALELTIRLMVMTLASGALGGVVAVLSPPHSVERAGVKIFIIYGALTVTAASFFSAWSFQSLSLELNPIRYRSVMQTKIGRRARLTETKTPPHA